MEMDHWVEVHGGARYKLEFLGMEDLPLFVDLMDRVAARLAVRGQDTWHDYLGFNGPDLLRARFVEGHVYVVKKNGMAIAGITLQKHNHVWKTDENKLALWVHIIARDPDLAEPGLGNALLGWAEGRARSKERYYLRLESEETNPGLQNYLLSLGYKPIAKTFHRDRDLILYEKQIPRVSG